MIAKSFIVGKCSRLEGVIGLVLIALASVCLGAEPATKPAAVGAAKPPLPVFVIGQKVELKWNVTWEPVKVVGKRGDWYLVEYEKWKGWREWAEPWRMRKVGSTYDIKEMSVSNPRVNGNEGPPRPTPGDAPGTAPAAGGGNPPVANVPKPPAGNVPPPAVNEDPFLLPPPKKKVPDADPFAPPSTGFPVKEVTVQPKALTVAAPAAWKLAPPAVPALANARGTMLPRDEFTGFQCKPRFCGSHLMIADSKEGPDAYSRLARINPTTGAIERFELNKASAPVELSPSGGLVVCNSNGFGVHAKSRLDIYRLGATIDHVVSFFPEGKEGWIKDVFWIDENTLCVNSLKRISVWDASTATGKWAQETSTGPVAVSADRKVIAFWTKAGIAVVNAADGSTVGVLPDTGGNSSLSFSPDGLRLFTQASSTLTSWDLQTGKLDASLYFSKRLPMGNMIALSKDYVLLGDALFSMAKKNVVARYVYMGEFTFGGGRIWAIGRDGLNHFLATTVCPHPQATNLIAQAPASVQILGPGTPLVFDFQVEVEDEKRQKIMDSITKRLTAAGYKLVDDAPFRLTARTEQGQPTELKYRMRRPGQPEAVENVTVTPKITRLILEHEGENLWSRAEIAGSSPGFIVTLKEGETLQDLANRSTYSVDWLATSPLPPPILQSAKPTLQFTMTLAGVKQIQ